jgi:hypothetical protein
MKGIFSIILLLSTYFAQAQKKWIISGQIAHESIKESKDFKNGRDNFRFVLQQLSIDTTLEIERKIGRGLALNFLLERKWKDFSLGIGLNFIPNREFSIENIPYLIGSSNVVLGEQSTFWRNELELPLRARYYFRIPKYKLNIAPSIAFMVGSAKNRFEQQVYVFTELNKTSRFSDRDWFVQRIAYQLDLSAFYEISDLNMISLGYYRQYDLISSDAKYMISGIRFGVHRAF